MVVRRLVDQYIGKDNEGSVLDRAARWIVKNTWDCSTMNANAPFLGERMSRSRLVGLGRYCGSVSLVGYTEC